MDSCPWPKEDPRKQQLASGLRISSSILGQAAWRRGCGLEQAIGHPLGRNNHAQSRLFRPNRTWRKDGYCREAPRCLGWVTAHRDIGQKSAVQQPNEALMPNPDHQQGDVSRDDGPEL